MTKTSNVRGGISLLIFVADRLCSRTFLALSLLFSVTTWAGTTMAQQNAAPTPAKQPELASDQDAIKARYKRFNLTLQQMAEILRKQDPERADLLFRALGKSQESRIEDQMALIFSLLNKDQPQLGEAIERQEELLAHLKNLLDLLQSEDRRSEIEKEKQRLQDLLKDINKLIGKEKDVRAGTERGDDSKKLTEKQENIAKDAKNLGEKIDQQDAEKNGEQPGTDSKSKPSSSSKSKGPNPNGSDDKPMESKSDDDKKPGDTSEKPDGEQKPGDEKKPSDDKKPMNGKPSESGKPGESAPKSDKSPKPSDGKSEQNQSGKPQDGQPQDGQPMPNGQQPQDNQQSQNDDQRQSDPKKQKTPGRKELEESRDAMQRAIEELKKQQRENASKEQDEAIRKLMEAKEKIEEILRQLREEEQKLMLAALEARFKKMLAAQLVIYHDTVRLSKADPSEKATVDARAVRLSQSEQEILIDADKALILLKEEGSSVAFPESVAAIRQDVQTLVVWLREAKVGELTQAVEKDVIEALEELIEALQKEMEKSDEEKKQQQQQQQQQQEDSQPLVDKLAELKMLRSLQQRVNRRTKQLSRSVEGEQATEADVVQQLQQLSNRQARIQQATSDLAKGKNK
jgi:hypothetical protein